MENSENSTNIPEENSTNISEETSKSKCKCTKWIKPIIILILIIASVICYFSSKFATIKKLEKFTAKVEHEYTQYNEHDLEKATAKFERIVKRVEKKKLNGKEESTVNELKGECKGYFAQAKARILFNNFQEALEDAGEEVKGAIKSYTGNE